MYKLSTYLKVKCKFVIYITRYIILSENDYTFSWTKGANRVKYGMAGDCYSRAYCPQGRFSINLSGTQLKLSSDVTWTGTLGASIEIDNIVSQTYSWC